MRVYRPAANWDDDMRTHGPTCVVLELENLPVFSGLYDQHGNKLMAQTVRQPAGFVHFREAAE